MKLITLLLSTAISLTAVAQEPNNKTTANDSAVAPSADFIALTEAYQNRSESGHGYTPPCRTALSAGGSYTLSVLPSTH